MNEYFNLLKTNPLFFGIAAEDFPSMLACLGVHPKKYDKNEIILYDSSPVSFVGIVLFGGANIIKEDASGHKNIVSKVEKGEMFAETLACAGVQNSPFSVVCTKPSEIAFFEFKRIITVCNSTCSFHSKLIENMLSIIATKNILLNRKIDIISKKTIREKLLCFFEYESKGKTSFSIKFNREELAAYLCADRSAVSNELSKMQKEGIIQYSKNHFKYIDNRLPY